MSLTERLTHAVTTALAAAGLPAVQECVWEVPRQAEHGDYATNVAMTLARAAKRAPRQIAEAIVRHFPAMAEVERLEIAGPGFLNVFLAPAWCARALHEVLAAGADYGRGRDRADERVRLEFVSANPTGPLVIVNARAAVIGALPKLPQEPALPARAQAEPLRQRRVYLGGWRDVPVYALDALAPGQAIEGAAIVESATTTVLLRAGDRATTTAFGWLDIQVGA